MLSRHLRRMASCSSAGSAIGDLPYAVRMRRHGSLTDLLRSSRAAHLQVPPVGVVRRARPLRRHHRRPQRRLRRAFLAERRAVVRLLQPLEHLPADAQRRLLRLDVVHFEEPLGVVVAVLVAQLEAALGDQADAAPLAVADLENVVDQPPRRRVALAAGRPGRTGSRPPPGPASSCRTVRSTPSSRSSGSKPVMTIGTSIAAGDRLVLRRSP